MIRPMLARLLQRGLFRWHQFERRGGRGDLGQRQDQVRIGLHGD
jgi:hypothetical protein